MADPTISTLTAVCEKFYPERYVVDNVVKGTPVLDALRRKMREGGSERITFDIEYGRVNGGVRAYNATRTLTHSPEIATQGSLDWSHYYVDVVLEQLKIAYNASDPRRLANYLNMYVDSAIATMRERLLSPDIFKEQTGNHMYSIMDAVSDSTTYAGINKTWDGLSQWQAVVAEADYTITPSTGKVTPISPYLENFSKMIRLIKQISGKTPDMIVTSGPVFDRLKEQINANDRVSATRSGDSVAWGYTNIGIDGVPIVYDLDFETAQCTDFDGNGDNRSECGGHKALFLNFDHLYMFYLKGWNMAWNKQGWQVSKGATDYFNAINWTGGIACTARREQGIIYGIDPDQDVDNFELMSDGQTNKDDFVSSGS